MIIIDAYNCLHAACSMPGPWNGFSLRQLCRLVESLDKKIVLVMDGSPKPDEPANAEFPDLILKYSGRGISADSVIITMVRQSTGARHITVVSNDRAVKAGAHRAGARTVGCEKYLAGVLRRRAALRLRRKAADPPRKSSGGSSDTEFWLHEFGFGSLTPKSQVPAGISARSGGEKHQAEFRIEDIDMEEILRRYVPSGRAGKTRSGN
jgi:hypothetical protein